MNVIVIKAAYHLRQTSEDKFHTRTILPGFPHAHDLKPAELKWHTLYSINHMPARTQKPRPIFFTRSGFSDNEARTPAIQFSPNDRTKARFLIFFNMFFVGLEFCQHRFQLFQILVRNLRCLYRAIHHTTIWYKSTFYPADFSFPRLQIFLCAEPTFPRSAIFANQSELHYLPRPAVLC